MRTVSVVCEKLNFYSDNKYISLDFTFQHENQKYSVHKYWAPWTYRGCRKLLSDMNNEDKLKKIMAKMVKEKLQNGTSHLCNKYKDKSIEVTVSI